MITPEYPGNEPSDPPQATDKLYAVSSIHLHDRELSNVQCCTHKTNTTWPIIRMYVAVMLMLAVLHSHQVCK